MNPSLLIAVPTYANPSAATVQTILGFQQFNAQIPTTIKFLSGFPWIDIARSELVGFFQHQTECSHVLFIDSDIGFNPKIIKDMLACDSHMVIGAYRTKSPPFAWTIGKTDGTPLDKLPIYNKRGGRIIEIDRGGLGCALISRKLIEALTSVNTHLNYLSHDPSISKPVCHLFLQGIKPDGNGIPRSIGEDAAFFNRVTEIGLKVECLLDVEISHNGIADTLGNYLK